MFDNTFIKKVDDWIYFCLEGEIYTINLYRVNVNGTKMKLLAEYCFDIHIINNHIFYGTWGNSDSCGIYRVNVDGSDKIRICDDEICDFKIVDDWIFYGNQSDDSAIYKIKIDGSEKTKVNSEISQYIIVCGDWIYYQNVTDDFKPYKIRLDGSERTKISDIDCSGGLYFNQGNGNIYSSVMIVEYPE
jgi:hypothetical protein